MANGHTAVEVFSTTGTKVLADAIECELRERMAESDPHIQVARGQANISSFSNENIEVQISNVRDRIALVLHTQTPPVSDGVIQLLALIDAINNAHPRQTFVVFPYMPYCRSDRKNRPRISVMGQRLPEILNKVLRVQRVMLLEPHDPHIKQYFVPTADEVPGVPLLVDHIKANYLDKFGPEGCVVVFADSSAAKRFEMVPAALGLEPAYMYKTRLDDTESPVIKAVSGKVRDRHCILVDDEILTGNTVLRDAEILKSEGAKSVRVLVVHGVLADKRLTDEELMAKLAASEVDEFVTTDSIPLGNKASMAKGKMTVIPIAPLLGEACKRMILGESLSALHRFGM